MKWLEEMDRLLKGSKAREEMRYLEGVLCQVAGYK